MIRVIVLDNIIWYPSSDIFGWTVPKALFTCDVVKNRFCCNKWLCLHLTFAFSRTWRQRSKEKCACRRYETDFLSDLINADTALRPIQNTMQKSIISVRYWTQNGLVTHSNRNQNRSPGSVDTLCTSLCKPNLSERKSDSERESVSSVWPER